MGKALAAGIAGIDGWKLLKTIFKMALTLLMGLAFLIFLYLFADIVLQIPLGHL